MLFVLLQQRCLSATAQWAGRHPLLAASDTALSIMKSMSAHQHDVTIALGACIRITRALRAAHVLLCAAWGCRIPQELSHVLSHIVLRLLLCVWQCLLAH